MDAYKLYLVFIFLLVPNAGMMETNDNDILALIKHVIKDVSQLTDHIKQQETRLTNRIQGIETKMSERMEQHEIRLKEQMKFQEVQLSEQIKQLDTNMTAQMEQRELKVVTKIEGLDTKMTRRLQGIETEVSEKIIELDTELSQEMQKHERILTGQIQLQKEQLSAQISQVHTDMTEQIDKQEVKVMTKIHGQDARLRVVENYTHGFDVGVISRGLKNLTRKMDGVNRILTGVLPGKTRATPAPSCGWLNDHNFNLKNGMYWISSSAKQSNLAYCNMEEAIVSECGGPKITKTPTVIKYPASGNYKNGESCEWNINTGGKVTISFLNFDLSDNVYCDYVEIHANGKKIGKWGIDTGIPPKQTLSGDVKIVFRTDSTGVSTGFKTYIY